MMKSNCYIWCAWKRITEGGEIKVYKSRTWFGWHTTWINNEGEEWEYTIPRMRRKPWWYVPILYNGVIKRVK
jgi:hypothetical protein